jgi:hypothetical protein
MESLVATKVPLLVGAVVVIVLVALVLPLALPAVKVTAKDPTWLKVCDGFCALRARRGGRSLRREPQSDAATAANSRSGNMNVVGG